MEDSLEEEKVPPPWRRSAPPMVPQSNWSAWPGQPPTNWSAKTIPRHHVDTAWTSRRPREGTGGAGPRRQMGEPGGEPQPHAEGQQDGDGADRCQDDERRRGPIVCNACVSGWVGGCVVGGWVRISIKT